MLLLFFLAVALRPKAASFARRWQLAGQVADARPEALSLAHSLWRYKVINAYPHDKTASTQGLVFHNQTLMESTGGHSQSRIRAVEMETGQSIIERALSPELYGEGLAVIGNYGYQLTWEENVCLVWDLDRMSLKKKVPFPQVGWGATSDGELLVTSDGSDTLVWRNPEDMRPVHQVQIKSSDGIPVDRLNELEFMHSEILANIFMTNYIARIDAKTGVVLGWIDCNGLLGPIERARAGVLNGIAYNPESDRIFVTGKTWPKLFEIELTTDSNETS